MVPRALTITFAGALAIGAYAGCSDGATDPTLGSGGYHGANGGTGSSSGGASGSSSGATSSGSSSGSTGSSSSSGSSSGGGADASVTQEAGPPPMTLQQAFTEFASCMSLTDFKTKGPSGAAAADIARAQTTQYGDCNACHNAGDGGFWASYGTVQGQDMTAMMFNQTKAFPYIAKWVTGTVDQNGQFKDLAPSNSIANQAILAQQCTPNTPCHPKFQLNPAVAQAISDFVTTTITKWHNNTCGSSTPTDAGTD